MNSAQLFTNFTDEDFTFYWDSVPYTVKAGQSIYLEDFKANHAAKHLIDQELNKQNIPTNTQVERDRLMKKIFGDTSKTVVAENQSALETQVLNENAELTEDAPRRGRRPAKAAKASDEEFEGLKE